MLFASMIDCNEYVFSPKVVTLIIRIPLFCLKYPKISSTFEIQRFLHKKANTKIQYIVSNSDEIDSRSPSLCYIDAQVKHRKHII